MFRTILGAVVVVSAALAPALAATLGPTPPLRPVYPHLHLNSPLNSHIVPRAGRDLWISDCAASETHGKRSHRKRDCRRDDRD